MDAHAHWCRSRDLGEWKACNCGATGRYAPTEDNGPGALSDDQGAGPAPARPVYAQGQHAVAPAEEQRCVPRYDDPEPRNLNSSEPILQFFGYAHLPPAIQDYSRPFYELAHWCVDNLPRNAERTVALRKILEAKDCAARAFIAKK